MNNQAIARFFKAIKEVGSHVILGGGFFCPTRQSKTWMATRIKPKN
jgi:ABC-type tungstate transport system substrate-binding protein